MNTHHDATRQRAHLPSTDPTGTRVVVASQGEASFYDVGSDGIVSVDERMSHIRGTSTHHATNAEHSPHQLEALVFARRIAAELERQRKLNRFTRIVLVAAPAFLGLLRESMHGPLRKMIVSQVRKDFAHRPPHVLQAHVEKLVAQRDW